MTSMNRDPIPALNFAKPPIPHPISIQPVKKSDSIVEVRPPPPIHHFLEDEPQPTHINGGILNPLQVPTTIVDFPQVPTTIIDFGKANIDEQRFLKVNNDNEGLCCRKNDAELWNENGCDGKRGGSGTHRCV